MASITFYGKSSNGKFQTLPGHLLDVYTGLNPNYGKLKRLDFDIDEVDRGLRLTALLHDVGKYGLGFQQALMTGAPTAQYAHAMMGAVTAEKIIANNFDNELIAVMLPLTIASHHTQLYDMVMERFEPKPCVYTDDAYADLSDLLANTMPEIRIDRKYMNNVSVIGARKLLRDSRLYVEKLFDEGGDIERHRIKTLYTAILNALVLSDSMASASFDRMVNGLNNGTSAGRINLRVSPPREVNLAFKPYGFQQRASNIDGNIILKAPCARGKTAAAVLWAQNQLKKNNVDRIIFTMPTRITSNNLRIELGKFFGLSNVKVYHSGDLYANLKRTSDVNATDIDGDSKYMASLMGLPVTVTTLDHLLLTLIHGHKHADIAYGSLLRSVVVIDEVHSYEPILLNHMLSALKLMNEEGVPHIAMTATMPNALLNAIGDAGEYDMLVDDEGMRDYSPVKLVRTHTRMFEGDKEDLVSSDFVRDVIGTYKRGERQLIVVNTVAKAQRLYYTITSSNVLKPADLIIIHSRFTDDDRRYREEALIYSMDWKVCISTQVCEMSLNISVPVMRTEICPVDALGQRMGRCNRKGKTPDGTVYVYDTEHTPYPRPYMPELMVGADDIVTDTDAVNYGLIDEWCHRLYDEIRPLQLGRDLSFYSVWQRCTPFGYTPRQVNLGDEDDGNGLIRLRSIDSTYAVPINLPMLKANLISIPTNLFVRHVMAAPEGVPEEDQLPRVNIIYDPRTGLDMATDRNGKVTKI